ncbi:MAG: DUF998 domain-containing protein [Stackebrandtia sp.]
MASTADNNFDRTAAVTRSLLGYGVIAGPIYIVVGLIQALTREGFDLSRHSLSLLANGSMGWIQVVNLIVSGLMVIAAAAGILRAPGSSRLAAILVGVYGTCMILGGVFAADPADGFPVGTPLGMPTEVSTSGLLHFVFGGLGFLVLAAAYFVLGSWFARGGSPRMALGSRISAAVMILSFFGGAASPAVTVPLLWLTVLVGWAWLAATSVAVYRTVPHPERRA